MNLLFPCVYDCPIEPFVKACVHGRKQVLEWLLRQKKLRNCDIENLKRLAAKYGHYDLQLVLKPYSINKFPNFRFKYGINLILVVINSIFWAKGVEISPSSVV